MKDDKFLTSVEKNKADMKYIQAYGLGMQQGLKDMRDKKWQFVTNPPLLKTNTTLGMWCGYNDALGAYTYQVGLRKDYGG